jgi:RNA polymerase-binding transcription factor DksA
MNANKPTRKNEGRFSPVPAKAILGPREQATKRKREIIPPKWEKHRKRLLALRSHLIAERRNHGLAVKEPLERFSMSMADAATDEFDHGLALSLLSAEQAALYEIDEALSRIEKGTYGICEITGNPIPESRLNALPWTRFSKVSARQLESKCEIGRVRLGKVKSVSGSFPEKMSEAEGGEERVEPLPNDESLFPTIGFSPKCRCSKG